MTLTTLITVNVVLGAVVLYGLVHLLTHGIRNDGMTRPARVESLPRHDRDRLAA